MVTSVDVEVPEVDSTPPPLFLFAPETTNNTPINVQGVTEPGVTLLVEGNLVLVESNGSFNVSVTLIEGDNLIEAQATDASNNVTQSNINVSLDTTPPVLSDFKPT